MAGLRTLVVWCPDWPVAATGAPPDAAVAVVAANRVIACSAPARAEGVRRGLRRREAQGRCPGLEMVETDPGRDARAFEPVVAAVEAFTAGIEILRPGMIAIGTRGPSRYFGGDEALAGKIARAVDAAVDAARTTAPAPATGAAAPATDTAATGAAATSPATGAPLGAGRPSIGRPADEGPGCRVGVADGRFPAEQAARCAGRERIVVVTAGDSGPFLAPLPVSTLPYPDLISLLVRLGIRTLGGLAALPAPSVLARFGPDGAEAHRLARGLDVRPLAARTPPPDLAVSTLLDPPAERVDTVAFLAKSLAADLHDRLGALGLGCTRVAIEAETEHGEHLVRLWRHDGTLSAGAIAERVRWQLDGWLSRGGTSGGLTLLRLIPDEVRPDGGRQMGFWGGATDDEGVARTLARLQGILGPDGVVTAVLGGGRDPTQQVRLVPWGDPRQPSRPGGPWTSPGEGTVGEGAAGTKDAPAEPDPHDEAEDASVGIERHWDTTGLWNTSRRTSRWPAPTAEARQGRRSPVGIEIPAWPGRLPGPAPALVHVAPLTAEVGDASGGPVVVSGRGVISADPTVVSIAGGPWLAVEAWAGPWPVEERWWDGGRRRARFQVVVAGGAAHLLAREAGRWWVEATYD